MTKTEERRLIKRALQDEQIRAFVLVVGSLIELPTDQARIRVLRYVADALEGQREKREQERGDV